MISMLPLWSKAAEDCIELPHLSRHVVGTWASGMPGWLRRTTRYPKMSLTHPRQLRNRQPPPAKLPSPKGWKPGQEDRVQHGLDKGRKSRDRHQHLGVKAPWKKVFGRAMCQLFQRLCSTCCNSAERKRGSS